MILKKVRLELLKMTLNEQWINQQINTYVMQLQLLITCEEHGCYKKFIKDGYNSNRTILAWKQLFLFMMEMVWFLLRWK
jgi:hypothetical protein